MERCPHCGKETIKLRNKFFCYGIKKRGLVGQDAATNGGFRFYGGKCPECNKDYIPSPSIRLMELILILIYIIKLTASVLLLVKAYTLISVLMLSSLIFDIFATLGIIGLFFPCVKYNYYGGEQIKPISNGSVTVKSVSDIKRMKIYGIRINEAMQTNESKAVFEDNIIPIRFVQKRHSGDKWYVEIFSRESIPPKMLREDAEYILIDKGKNIGLVKEVTLR